jgi:hypothetical protein
MARLFVLIARRFPDGRDEFSSGFAAIANNK